MNPSEQHKRDEDFLPCECKLCGHKGQAMYFVTLFDYGGLLKNRYGLPNGSYCILCVSRIESKMNDTGKYIGQEEIEKLLHR